MVTYRMLNGESVDPSEVLATGGNGVVLRKGDRVLKIPMIIMTSEAIPLTKKLEYFHSCNISSIDVEKSVYQRVWPHPGLLDHYQPVPEGFFVEFLPAGSLHTFMCTKPRPNQDVIDSWTVQLMRIVMHFHNSKVLLYDIVSYNTLIADDGSLKLIDFGQSTVLPLEQDMRIADDGCTVKTDIFALACLLYSIARWEEFDCELVGRNWEFPPLAELPNVQDLRFGSVMLNCWQGRYECVEEALEAVASELRADDVHSRVPESLQ